MSTSCASGTVECVRFTQHAVDKQAEKGYYNHTPIHT